MSRNEKRIRIAAESVGVYVESIRWEPIGKNFEMCGRSGGWILNDFYPLGYSVEEAIDHLIKHPSWFESISEHEEEIIGIESEESMIRCDDINFEALADVAESAYQGLGEAMRDVQRLGVPWSVSLRKFVSASPAEYIAWAIGKRVEYRDQK